MSPGCGVLGVLWETGTPKKLWASEIRGRLAKTSPEHLGPSLGAAEEGDLAESVPESKG